MAVEVRMPALGMTMEEGKIVGWRVREGDPVTRGQVLVEIESEKVSYEVEAPTDGIVGRILVPQDGVARVGTPLVVIVGVDEPVSSPAPVPAAPRAGAERPLPAPGADAGRAGRQRLSPRARVLAQELGVDPASVTGSGADGSIVEKDIREAAARADRPPHPAPAAAGGEADFTLRPLTGMRRVIASRMVASTRETPHFFLGVEVDAGQLLRYRDSRGPRLQTETGVELTVSDLLAWVTARVLAGHRALNAFYSPEGIREWHDVNLGLAVAVDDGLIVPVIRQAQRRPLREIMLARSDLVARARTQRLTPDDLEGGTFTLSNLGPFGIDFFTSILNPPQAAILSVGAIRERPAVVGGLVVARPLMTVGLTIDHRVTDGAAGARFLRDFRNRIEAPDPGE